MCFEKAQTQYEVKRSRFLSVLLDCYVQLAFYSFLI